MERMLFAGVEGGASSSKLVILDQSGRVVSRDDSGPATNHLLIGESECFARITRLLDTALSSLPRRSRLQSLALCLSGCEDPVSNDRLARHFLSHAPHLTATCFVRSDLLGALATCGTREGVVLIAGTGSNCLLVRADGSEVKCGGWGHVIGDYGSAYWIAKSAVKVVVESEERYNTWHASQVARVRQTVFSHFGAQTCSELLEPLYGHFDKSHVAALTRQLAALAEEEDPVAVDLFRRAGRHLGRHVTAVVRQSAPLPRAVTVACVGSVFKSFSALRSGLLEGLSPLRQLEPPVTLHFRQLTTSAAVGAALLGARESGHVIADEESACETRSRLLMSFNCDINE